MWCICVRCLSLNGPPDWNDNYEKNVCVLWDYEECAHWLEQYCWDDKLITFDFVLLIMRYFHLNAMKFNLTIFCARCVYRLVISIEAFWIESQCTHKLWSNCWRLAREHTYRGDEPRLISRRSRQRLLIHLRCERCELSERQSTVHTQFVSIFLQHTAEHESPPSSNINHQSSLPPPMVRVFFEKM